MPVQSDETARHCAASPVVYPSHLRSGVEAILRPDVERGSQTNKSFALPSRLLCPRHAAYNCTAGISPHQNHCTTCSYFISHS